MAKRPSRPSSRSLKSRLSQPRVAALIYFLVSGLLAWQIIAHTQKETDYFSRVCRLDDFENNIIADHPVVGPIIRPFVNNKDLHLPTVEESKKAFSEMTVLGMEQKKEGVVADIWSGLLLLVSSAYFAWAYFFSSKDRSDRVSVSITLISAAFFVVGIAAPALVIAVVSPNTAVVRSFILDYSTRSVLGVISSLYSTQHWIIAIALTLFSLIVPVMKAGLLVYAVEYAKVADRIQVSKILNLIGKWSMADVFVAGIILANFAIKADKSEPQTELVMGFYYFLGYCLVSLAASTLFHLRLAAKR